MVGQSQVSLIPITQSQPEETRHDEELTSMTASPPHLTDSGKLKILSHFQNAYTHPTSLRVSDNSIRLRLMAQTSYGEIANQQITGELRQIQQ